MRDIKFRAWDRPKQVMVYEVEKFYDTLGTFHNSKGEDLDIYKETSLWEYQAFGDMIIDNGKGKIDLMQYTGLKDKNGKEIYEGDIVKFESSVKGRNAVGSIKWDEFCWAVNSYKDNNFYGYYGYHDAIFDWNKLEVIGNIHENPELLEVRNDKKITP